MSWQEGMPARSASAPNTQTTALKKGKCFICGKPGHWAAECPTKKSSSSVSQPKLNTSRVASLSYSEVICPCGAGVCEPRFAKTSGDVYYKCPAESWMRCDFFTMRHNLGSVAVRQLEYPICECGAGVCLLGQEAATGREYFKCRVPKGQGACSFRQWVDELVSYTKRVTVEETDYLTTPQSLGKQASRSLFEEDDSRRKCLRITELDGSLNTNSRQFYLSSVASFVSSDTKEGSSMMSGVELDYISPELLKDIMEYDYPLTEDDESSFKLRKTPESEENTISLSPSAQLSTYSAVSDSKGIPTRIETGLQEYFEINEEFINEVIALESTITNVDEQGELSYDSLMEEVVDTAPAKLPDHKTVQRLQANFERRIVAAATDYPQDKCVSVLLGAQYLGWLSRLAFASPRCMILPLAICWFCYMFPNFDPIYVPRGTCQFNERAQTVLNSVAKKYLTVPRESFVEDVPVIILKEPSAAGSSPYVAEPDNVIAAAILEAFGQAAMLIQTNFITRLESMNPLSHESMTKEANTVFASLDHLKVDYRSFHIRVKEFIDAAASLNQMELSVCDDALLQESLVHLNKEKIRLEQLSSEHSSVMKSFTCSQERVQSLINEAEEVRNRLFQIEQQVSAFQTETNDLNILLAELSDQIKESQNNLQSASREAEAAQKLSSQKSAALSAAWDTFEQVFTRRDSTSFLTDYLAMPLSNDTDHLNPPVELERQKHKLKRSVPSPNSYFMDVKCPGCFTVTTIFSRSQTAVACPSCKTILCQPTGGKARLTEGCSFRKKE